MILRAAALLLLLASPAAATTDAWPALYYVEGVAADDVLNIRAAPSATSDIVGNILPGTEGIEVIEVTRDERWGLVNTAEGTGWASLAFLVRRPGQWWGLLPEALQCVGTEPFWSLSLNPDGATFASPEALPLDFAPSAALRSRNRSDRHAGVYENDLGGLVATLRNASCSDGMSDRTYGWEVDAMLVVAGSGNAQLFSGCCSIVDR